MDYIKKQAFSIMKQDDITKVIRNKIKETISRYERLSVEGIPVF